MTKKIFFFIFLINIWLGQDAFASEIDGTIDSANKYAWGENVGWINFGTTEGDVHVTDSSLSGYAWGENIGWISLNCANTSSCATVDYKVANDSEGNLSGYAWAENTGWINFDPTGGGVSIDSSGDFSGYAWGENIGWIVFLSDYKVSTDWRPASSRTQDEENNVSGGGSGFSLPSIPSEEPPAEEIPPVETPPVVETPIDEAPPYIPPVIEPEPDDTPPSFEDLPDEPPVAGPTEQIGNIEEIEDSESGKSWTEKISWKIALPAGGALLILAFILIRPK